MWFGAKEMEQVWNELGGFIVILMMMIIKKYMLLVKHLNRR